MRRLPSLLLGGLLALAPACSREPAAAPPRAAPVGVTVAAVRRVSAPLMVPVTGTVRPAERAVIAARISGTIESLPLALGQAVRRGELLVRLAAPELSARLAQARALLGQAEREERRDRALAATGADPADAARNSADRLRAAQAAAAEAEAMVGYAEIRAPYDGRVAGKFAYAGDLATPGAPLLVLESSAALQVEAPVPASLAPLLAPGRELSVEVSGAPATTGRIVEIAAAADDATRTVLMKLALAAPDPAWSGRSARLEIPGPGAEALLVPASCVSRFGQIERVFVVVNRQAELRIVRTGAARGNDIELLAGVAAGEVVVVAPPGTLHDGQPVSVAP